MEVRLTKAADSTRLDADLLTRAEVERLLQACSRRAPTGVRNKAMIVLAWRCGLRISEVLALRPKDIDLDGGLVTVQRGKGDRRRTVGIDPGACAIVARWLDVRSKLGVSARSALICTLDGGAIDPSYVRHLLPRLARRAGIEKRVHAHALRHLFAVELEQEGAPVSAIRDLLGHADLGTTDRYLRRLGASPAVEFARTRCWTPGTPTTTPVAR
jgi:integrase/recombinase XerD